MTAGSVGGRAPAETDSRQTATVDELILEARSQLAAAPFRPPGREAFLLLGKVLGLGEAQVMARGGAPVSPACVARFRALLARRLSGEPMAYLFAEREFFGRSFTVDERVLVPRPETEHLVEEALAWPLPPEPRILDLGTGSGCLAVTLAAELPDARVVAVDCSTGALAVARGNAARHGVGERVAFVAGDLTAGLRLSGFDLVVSNPPYIPTSIAAELSPEVREFEPSGALFAGEDGLHVIRRLIELGEALAPGCGLLFEIGDGQLPAIEAIFAEPYGGGERGLDWLGSRADYASKARVVLSKRV